MLGNNTFPFFIEVYSRVMMIRKEAAFSDECSEDVCSILLCLQCLFRSLPCLFGFSPGAYDYACDTVDEADGIEADCEQQGGDLISSLFWVCLCQEHVAILLHDGKYREEYYSADHEACTVHATTFRQWVHSGVC